MINILLMLSVLIIAALVSDKQDFFIPPAFLFHLFHLTLVICFGKLKKKNSTQRNLNNQDSWGHLR